MKSVASTANIGREDSRLKGARKTPATAGTAPGNGRLTHESESTMTDSSAWPPDENWRQIPSLGPAYEASDQGRARKRLATGGFRLLKNVVIDGGYHVIRVKRDGKQRKLRIHRLVLEAFVGPCPDGMECCHNDGDPGNNRLSNLRWDTKSANEFDQVRHGTHVSARKTRCKMDHPFDAVNTVARRDGGRDCRACRRDRSRIRMREVRARQRANAVNPGPNHHEGVADVRV